MIGYKFKHTGTIGTEVVTANCGSDLYFAVSNSGDSEATVKLFNGETELSADTTNLKFVLPDNEYSQFHIITPETPETKEYTAVITSADESYVHKIPIRLIAEQSSKCLEDVLYYKIDDLVSIGNRVLKVPLNSSILVGIPFSSNGNFYQYLTIDNSYLDSSLKQSVERLQAVGENPSVRVYSNQLQFGTYPLILKTGIQPYQKHIKAQVHSKSRTIEYRDVPVYRGEVTLKDGTTEYFAIEQDNTNGVGHIMYHLDSENNVLGYVDSWILHGTMVMEKVGGRLKQVWYETWSVDASTVVGDFPLEIMPWCYRKTKTGGFVFVTNGLLFSSTTYTEYSETLTLNNVPYTVYTDNATKEIDILFDIVDKKTMINTLSGEQTNYYGYRFDFNNQIGDNVVSVPEGIVPTYFCVPKEGQISSAFSMIDTDSGNLVPTTFATYIIMPNYYITSIPSNDVEYYKFGTHRFKVTVTITNPDETTTTKTLYIRLEHNNDTKFE